MSYINSVLLYVSFRVEVNLSNTWKHNIEIIFLNTFLLRHPEHASTRSAEPQAIHHSCSVSVPVDTLCKQVFKSGNTHSLTVDARNRETKDSPNWHALDSEPFSG